MDDELPGREIPKEYRDVVNYQREHLGWRYVTGKGYPKLYPADRTQRPIAVPKTPSKGTSRSFTNWIAHIRRAGGIWPPQEG